MKVALNRNLLFVLFLIGFSISAISAQNSLLQAEKYVQEHLQKFKLVTSDVEDWVVSNNYISKHNGVNHVYFQQTVNGIPVEGALINVNVLKNGEILNAHSRFVSNIQQKAKKSKNISALKALQLSLQDLKISIPRNLEVKERQKNAREEVLFSKIPNVEKDMSVKLVYVENEKGEILLAWVSEIYSLEPQFDVWSVYIDAASGKLIKKVNAVLNCTFGDHGPQCQENHENHEDDRAMKSSASEEEVFYSGDSYLVFDSPVESPNHGSRTLITDPANPLASPFGWHDTNGAAGAEFTITRGNNVYAQDDINGNNGSGYSPDGGAELHFDFTLDYNESPSTNTPSAQNLNSAITNLFYWNNIVHDVFYVYGFDEVSGNFQQNNYGNGGIANDHVLADALDGSDSNNARFFTSTDGTSGRMEMYLWTGGGSQSTFNVNSPTGLAGQYESAGAQFGASSYNITGDLVIVNDGSANPSEGCGTLTNTTEIDGNIALIDRGNCEFGLKALNAQNAGAVAVIICNNVAGSPISMVGGTSGGDVTIPVIMIRQDDCATIKLDIPTVSVTLTGSSNPAQFDGSYDNGIIAHEYGHGISTRLTGGAATNACLGNQEQGGEGWSDFFGLVLTHEVGDDRNTSRGIGTYVIGQPVLGGGIRPYPYTTDMSINPSTYDDIKTLAIPHGVGSVLCTMLWDLYWDLIDKHGYNPDLSDTGSGNGIAIQLVLDGLKLQPCSPGFTDVRDAILAADEVNNGGANRCLIWNAFARRGLGVSADQGDTNNRSDGTEAFDIPSDFAIDEVIPVTEAFEGEVVTIRSEATCGCEAKTGVQFKHTIPSGLSIISVSEGTQQGNEIRSNLVSLEAFEKVAIEYTARVDLCNSGSSELLFEDDVEGTDNFTPTALQFSRNWGKSTTEFTSPSNSWYAQNFAARSDFVLTMNNGISIIGPTELSFYHRFQTEENWDGGVVEISTNNGSTWQVLDSEFTQNGYTSAFAGNAPHALAGLNAFTGSSDAQFAATGFVQSIANLSSFEGENILIRFRFATDRNTAGGGINGWYIDDILIKQVSAISLLANVESSSGSEGNDTYLIEVKDLDQEVIFVDKTTNGKKYGGEWANAFSSVQDALQLAACNESISQIWVKGETYYPTESTNQSLSFNLSDGLSLYGGFAGGESLLSARDPMIHQTVLSGDIGLPGNNIDNTLHVVVADNISVPAIIDGFVIEKGNAVNDSGGGLKILNSNLTISNCVIASNNAQNSGGGMFTGNNSQVNFKDCTFQENTTASGNARALSVAGTSNVVLEDCKIIDADVASTGSAVENTENSSMTSKGLVEIQKNN
jgi:hypothetical protein